MSLKLSSLNINGLSNSISSLARFITKHKIHITCLQETHTVHAQYITHFTQTHNFTLITNTNNPISPHIPHRQGTALIINNNLFHSSFTYHSVIIVPNRIQCLFLKFQSVSYIVINVYLPSGKTNQIINERKNCLNHLFKYLISIDVVLHKIFLAGDFNFVLHKNDRKQDFRPHSVDKLLFCRLLSNFNLSDVFRALNPHQLLYTFSRTNPTSRLDRIYIPNPELSSILSFKHHHITFSDHFLAPTLLLKTSPMTCPRPSVWKLNDSIFLHKSNIQCFHAFIALHTQSPKILSDPLAWWDSLKHSFKQYLILLSKWTRRNDKLALQQLTKKLSLATASNQQEEIIALSAQIEKHQTHKLQGHEIRARMPPLCSIDNPSPLAPILEHSRQQNLRLPTNPTSEPSPATTPPYTQFLTFFQNLWNPLQPSPTPHDYLAFLRPDLDPALCETPPASPLITPDEVRMSIKLLNKRPSPGSDGLTSAFYSLFPSLATILSQTYNNSYFRNQLAPSQSLAIIRLIPKHPNPSSVTDWRPISLLNTDYKILSTIKSNRLKPLLNHIISPEQQCGLPNRQIFNNHLNIKSALEFAQDFSQPLALVQIDFYKAFDSISHDFLLLAAERLGIPPSLLKWIRIFLHNLTAQINLNGYLSDSILIKRGIRQGCPLSMLLFIIGIKLLTRGDHGAE